MSGDDKSDKVAGEGRVAKTPGREPLRPERPRRFYASVDIEPVAEGYALRLDGRRVKTPAKRMLAVPTRRLAEAIAAEWQGQGERIEPDTMPLTKLANSAIDAVAEATAAVRGDIRAFAGSDLLCYRAEGPPGLGLRQARSWDPVLSWAEQELGTRFRVVSGVMPIRQSDTALAAIENVLATVDAFRLTALHTLTTLLGSAVLALACRYDRFSPDAVWSAAHVDEDWQIELWGRDAEADERRAWRRLEFDAACRMLRLLDDAPGPDGLANS